MFAPAQFQLNLLGRLVYSAMLIWFCRSGWRAEGHLPPEHKFILVGAPHTSNWDFLVFVGTIAAFGKQVHSIGKRTLFRWPFAAMMRGLGGVPVDRSAPRDLVQQMADQFAARDNRDNFVLIVAPEGTRDETDHWKTGFYQIALAAAVPMVCAAPTISAVAGSSARSSTPPATLIATWRRLARSSGRSSPSIPNAGTFHRWPSDPRPPTSCSRLKESPDVEA